MTRSVRTTGLVLGTFWLCLMPFDLASQDEPASGAATLAMQTAFPPELKEMFPIGRVFKGVAIPSYTGENLKSVMHASSITRVDKSFLDIIDLVVLVYNGSEKPETTISMDEAAYDMTTGVLRSKTPSKIEQPKFVMTGDTMTFHQQTQVSRLEGNVKIVIPDAGKFSPGMGRPISK